MLSFEWTNFDTKLCLQTPKHLANAVYLAKKDKLQLYGDIDKKLDAYTDKPMHAYKTRPLRSLIYMISAELY